MQNFNCNFQPYSLFAQGGKLGNPTQPTFTNIMVNRRGSYMLQVPVIISNLRIQSLCSIRRTFECGNNSRLKSVAHELMSVRSFSSKRKKFKSRATSKEVCNSSESGGTEDGGSTLRVYNGSKKRDNSTVCNSINGQKNAAVSNPAPSKRKGTNKKGANMPVSTASEDAQSKQTVKEDSSSNKGHAESNDNAHDETSGRRNGISRNKKENGKECVQDRIGNEAAKSSDKVQGAETSGYKKQARELSGSSSAAFEVRSSNKKSKDSTRTSNDASHSTKSNSPDISSGESKQKQIRPLYPPSGKSVIVVESITKARVIQNYLGDMYEVLPSHGHLRDLAGRSGSVRPDDDFSMVWEVPATAWTHLKSIKVALNG